MLGGAVLITQHWVAALAVSLFGIALLTVRLRRPSSSGPILDVLPAGPMDVPQPR
jgi:hypothetical protein